MMTIREYSEAVAERIENAQVVEIEKANGIKNSVVYEGSYYKIPIFQTESDYLDLNTVVGYELSDEGVLLITEDGNGYLIKG